MKWNELKMRMATYRWSQGDESSQTNKRAELGDPGGSTVPWQHEITHGQHRNSES